LCRPPFAAQIAGFQTLAAEEWPKLRRSRFGYCVLDLDCPVVATACMSAATIDMKKGGPNR
jgi:hypothetical protein